MSLSVPTELVAAARDGDRAALERLLEASWPHAYRIARSITGCESLAQDAAQEACALVYRRISSLRTDGAFRAWFYRLVVRQATSMLRKDTGRTLSQESHDPFSDRATAIDVRAALERLPMPLRTALVLHYYADLNSTEIGGVLDVPAATVRFRLTQGRRRLQSFLQDHATKETRSVNEVPL